LTASALSCLTDHFAAVVADPDQPSLFSPSLDTATTVLTSVTV
jgi:hypothetical protein